ncbi:caveolae-associated protein 4a-like [Seriola lalandi dorsalis]|uniref:Muscle-restricted coiled-coil protein n=1 Tax=Seriola lalandi dorsalis TaxID=1841481 RepID=A0A3B4WF25_SERLL|nr:caveolae-associated protein 4a-like [Seriola lalandi dorsalis]XP_056247386.1 caveolae-associated protein 4a [Seriola aureovittata]
MDQHKYRTAGVQEKLEIIGVEDEAGNPISALTILSLLERVAGIIDNVQSCQQRMEERQLELENNIKTIQGDVLKLAKDHTDTSGTVEKLLQKTRKVSANVKEVRTRVEKQNVRVKKVESTQDELLTRNKFRVVIYQGETEIPSVAVTKSPKGTGLDGLEIDPDSYDIPADLSSDEEYLSVEETDSSRAARLKKSVVKSTETLKAAFSKENMSKTKDNLGTKFHHLGEKVMPPERREKMHQAGERLKQSGERLKENIAKKAPNKETFRIKLKKERAVGEGQEGAEADPELHTQGRAEESPVPSPGVTYTEVGLETKREGPVEESSATRIG